jgi:type I restriction enzyme S subunit
MNFKDVKFVKLGSITKWTSGGTPSKKNKDYWDGCIPWISARNLKSNFVYSSDITISELGLKNGSRIAPVKSILLLVRGSGLFNDIPIGLVEKEVAFNQDLKCIQADSDAVLPEYIFYWLLGSKQLLRSILEVTGIGAGKFDTKLLQNLEIPLPSIKEQELIVKLCDSIFRKIEMNDRISQVLEDIAQVIFKQWFIDFEFPNEDGEPYKSSGGEMIESELGMIPKGWEVGTLNDISLDIITGKTPSTKDKNNFNGDIPFVKIPDMHDKVFVTKTESYLSDKGAVKNKIIPPNSIIVSCIATPGLVSLASEECQTNQQINTIINKYEKMYYYTYFLLTSLSEHIRTLGSTGSTTLNLNKGQFSKIKVLIPLRKVTKNYHDLVDPLFKEILTNAALDEELTQIRDSLLPKLMSGEIRVPLDEEGEAS